MMTGMRRVRKLFGGPSERIRASQDRPPTEDPQPVSALITQDSAQQSTLIAQSLFDSGALAEGQTVTVEGHRVMRVTVERGRVVLV